jgi:signal transduction histidine kinase
MGANTRRDIQTELEMTQEALRLSERHLVITTEALRKAEERAVAGRLALEVMHEVKNPLEALGYLTYLASQEADDPAKVRMYLLQAQEQMENLSHIAKKTLGFSQQMEKPRPIDFGSCDGSCDPHSSACDRRKTNPSRERPARGGSGRGLHWRNASGRVEPHSQCFRCIAS